jgi:hypothetical protein
VRLVRLEHSSRGSLRACSARTKISRSLEAQQQKALRDDVYRPSGTHDHSPKSKPRANATGEKHAL